MLADWFLPDALTDQAEELRSAWWFFLVAAAVVGVVVYALIAFTLVRYRRRDDRLPRQVHYRIGVEIAYTVIPVLLVAALIVVTLQATAETDASAADPDVVVEVRGFQWQWQFTYRDADVVVTGQADAVPELVLPVDRTVRFEVTSDDVIHSFWVPGFLYKRDLIPGSPQSFDVDMGERTGTWSGACAEYCGLEHAAMRFELRVVPASEFDDWLAGGGGAIG